jgi:hypothetical protein
MRLTQEVARKNVGKYIDCRKRMFGYYPMQIILIDGKAHLRDRVDVCMPIPETEEDFNSQYYDFMYENGGVE